MNKHRLNRPCPASVQKRNCCSSWMCVLHLLPVSRASTPCRTRSNSMKRPLAWRCWPCTSPSWGSSGAPAPTPLPRSLRSWRFLPPICVCVCVCVRERESVCVCVSLSVSICVCVSLSLSVCLSVCLSLFCSFLFLLLQQLFLHLKQHVVSLPFISVIVFTLCPAAKCNGITESVSPSVCLSVCVHVLKSFFVWIVHFVFWSVEHFDESVDKWYQKFSCVSNTCSGMNAAGSTCIVPAFDLLCLTFSLGKCPSLQTSHV